MKHVKLFYLDHCPHCKKTKRDLDELMKDEKYSKIQIEWIEESKEKEIADQYDYYYVPCFYVDEIKMKEGALQMSDVKEVLDAALSDVF